MAALLPYSINSALFLEKINIEKDAKTTEDRSGEDTALSALYHFEYNYF